MRYYSLTVLVVNLVLCAGFKMPEMSDIKELYEKLNNKVMHGPRVKRAGRPTIGDKTPNNPYEVNTDDIPRHTESSRQWEILHRYMPTLGNGFIAATVYNYTLFMNGYYCKPKNGKNNEVHRAPIPTKVMFQPNFTHIDDINRPRTYTFNIYDGFFQEQIDTSFAYIQVTSYIHKKYDSLLVVSLTARRIGSEGGEIVLQRPPQNNATSGLIFGPVDTSGNVKYGYLQKARQEATEDGAATKEISMYWTPVPQKIQVGGSNPYPWFNWTFVMSVNHDDNKARQEFEYAASLVNTPSSISGHVILFNEHAAAWHRVWEQTGYIEMKGNIEVTKLARFATYYILSSLPTVEPSRDEDQPIFSRTSLAKGSIGTDYQGHAFWDNEIYVMPAILMFQPNMAKMFLRYRSDRTGEAAQLAQSYGDKGYRFPWESGVVGRDVTPDTCTDCRDKQIHINGAISFAARQYYAATRDEDVKSGKVNMCDMHKKFAEFWVNRAKWNATTQRYHINNVTGPDDFHPNVNNNAYTNAVASYSIHYARYFACICGGSGSSLIPDEWLRIAYTLYWPYDENKKFHDAFEGMSNLPDSNLTFKQADTTLLGYPLIWNMSSDIQRKDLDYYHEKIYRGAPINAMTYSFHSIGYMAVGYKERAEEMFSKAYSDYVARPFHIWTEYMEDSDSTWKRSTVNYLPAAGAFLQSIVFGWTGLRLRVEQLELFKPMLPTGTTEITLHGFKYLGNNMTLTFKTDVITIQVHVPMSGVQSKPLRVKRNNTGRGVDEQDLEPGQLYTLNERLDTGFMMFSTEATGCDVPEDYIIVSYSPWLNTAPSHYGSILTVLFTLSLAHFISILQTQ